MIDKVVTPFAVIVITATTEQGLLLALESCRLAAGTVSLILRPLQPVNSAGQPSTFSDQKVSHIVHSTSMAAIFAMAFSWRYSSFFRP